MTASHDPKQPSKKPTVLALYEAFMPQESKENDAKIQFLEKDTGMAGIRFRELLEHLENIAKEKDRGDVNRRLVSFLKEMFINALSDFGISTSRIPMEICVAGSLAKSQATAYSDVDCFLILGDSVSQLDKQKLQEVTRSIYYLSDGLFKRTKQFSMDPVGISMHKMNGTVSELVEKIQAQEPEGTGPLTTSVCNAKSISGKDEMLLKLQQALNTQLSPTTYFEKAITEYPGPKTMVVHIKSDLIRPIDFILQGFRKRENLSAQEYDQPKFLLEALVEKHVISDAVSNLIQHIQNKVSALRSKAHADAKKESDEIAHPTPEVLELVDLVGWLRGSLAHHQKQAKQNQVFDLQLGKHLSASANEEKLSEGRLQKIAKLQHSTYGRLREENQALPKKVMTTSADSKLDEKAAKGKSIFAPIPRESKIQDFPVHDAKITRALNTFKSPHSPASAKTIATSLDERLSDIEVPTDADPEDLKKLVPTVLPKAKSWLNEVLHDHVFPQLLDASGMVQPQIWRSLNLDQAVGSQQNCSQKTLSDVSYGLVVSYVTNILNTLPEVQHTLQKRRLAYVFSLAQNELMKRDSYFVQYHIVKYYLSPIIQSLLKIKDTKLTSVEDPYGFIQDTLGELTDETKGRVWVKIKDRYGLEISAMNVMEFVQTHKLEFILTKKYRDLQSEDQKLQQQENPDKELLQNRHNKNELLYRTIIDIQDYRVGRLTMNTLIVSIEDYIEQSKAIPHTAPMTALIKETDTTSLLQETLLKLKGIRSLEPFFMESHQELSFSPISRSRR